MSHALQGLIFKIDSMFTDSIAVNNLFLKSLRQKEMSFENHVPKALNLFGQQQA